MAHIHKLIDFIVSAYIVHNNKVLLVKHRSLKNWLPIGGHIELDEDPEEAIAREIKEECGLEVEIIKNKPEIQMSNFKFLNIPSYLDIHKISDTHRHIAFEYFAKAKSDKVILNKKEHNDIRWFSLDDLEDDKFNLLENIKFLSKEALNKVK